jgi:hypothetical protein
VSRAAVKQFSEADHESFWVPDLEVAFSPFGILERRGRETLPDEIAAKAVDPTNAENDPNPAIPGAVGYMARIDRTLARAHRREGSLGSAI